MCASKTGCGTCFCYAVAFGVCLARPPSYFLQPCGKFSLELSERRWRLTQRQSPNERSLSVSTTIAAKFCCARRSVELVVHYALKAVNSRKLWSFSSRIQSSNSQLATLRLRSTMRSQRLDTRRHRRTHRHQCSNTHRRQVSGPTSCDKCRKWSTAIGLRALASETYSEKIQMRYLIHCD